MERSFENLKVWQKSKAFIIKIYKALSLFPVDEKYSMVDQIKRCSNSICANIAEGTGKNTDKDLINYLYIARGSLNETKSFLIVANELGFLNDESFVELYYNANEIGKMLNGLINSLKKPKDYIKK
ncbi:MAG: four helix bundle protein [Eubacteriaceae bacterium]